MESCTISSSIINRYGFVIIGWSTTGNQTTSIWNTGIERAISYNQMFYAITVFNYLSNSLGYNILMSNTIKTGANYNVIVDDSNRISQEGLFSAQDNYGISYFFRGTHEGLNNNVLWAGYQWKIIRIDGLGNIRMLYNGTEAHFIENGIVNVSSTPASKLRIGLSAVNMQNNNEAFNYTNSLIVEITNTFFYNLPEAAKKQVVLSSYCNDREIADLLTHQLLGMATVGSGRENSPTVYSSYQRLFTGDRHPTLICPTDYNVILNVGLITADEIAMAGGVRGQNNSQLFLRGSEQYWTMTPVRLIDDLAEVWFSRALGGIDEQGNVNSSRAIRPVITLRANVIVKSGIGTANSPYIIQS